jgi:glyoxylase-like metal-dependent hydrolase (beta-lactamase superfamily II)
MIKQFLAVIVLLIHAAEGLPQSPHYEVYALQVTAPSKPFAAANQVLGAADTAILTGVFMFWLIKGGNGKNILVDAGFPADIEELKTRAITGYVPPDSMLLRIGIKASAITDIIITHPHWDHLDGVNLFPYARIWMQKGDFNYCMGAAWQKDGNKAGLNKRDMQKLLVLNLEARLVLLEGDDQEIIPGIKAYTGFRHSFNSQYVLVATGGSRIVIASDNTKFYYNLEHLKSLPATGTFNTTAYVTAMRRMKTLVADTAFIVPGHDALLFTRFPLIKEGISRIK